jgi:hypothetical protein
MPSAPVIGPGRGGWGRPVTRCCWRWRARSPAAVVDANFYPDHGPGLLQACQQPIEVFCCCSAAEVERRFTRRVPTRHPGHVDHVLDAQLKAALDAGVGPLGLGGPVLEVDTSGPVDVTAVASWVKQQPQWHPPMPPPPTHDPARKAPRDQADRYPQELTIPPDGLDST